MLHARKDYQHIQDPEHKIPEDEPVFLLRAQDKAAAATVGFWIAYQMQNGGHADIITAARIQQQKMLTWPVKKIADLPQPSTKE